MAITTVYNGIEYRSRLEARWAAFMQNIGWDIVYEPFDGDGYIPDFLVQGDRPLLVEVKPAVTATEYQSAVPKAEKGLQKHWSHDILIVGASPFPGNMGNSNGETAGWLGEEDGYGDGVEELAIELARGNWPATEADVRSACEREGFDLNWVVGGAWSGVVDRINKWVKDGEPSEWFWDAADWITCRECGRIAVYHTVMMFGGRPCWCASGGDHHLGTPPMDLLRSMWADACNDVKWRGRPM